MSSTPRWSTFSSCATEGPGAAPRFAGTDRRGRRAARLAVFGLLVAAAALAGAARPVCARPKPVRLTLTGSGGERTVEGTDLRFVYFHTRYRRTRVPVEESPTRQRLEVLSDRDDCRCVRFADYSRVKFTKIREIEIVTHPGERSATVRVSRLDGRTNEYPVDRLWGGGEMFPPHFSVTIDGVEREFLLRLADDTGATWPDEMLTRALLVRRPPPPGRRR